jgi:hypothetical protein
VLSIVLPPVSILLVSRPRYRSSGSAAFVAVHLLFIVFLLGFPVCVSARASEARCLLRERVFPAISNNKQFLVPFFQLTDVVRRISSI